VAVADAAKVRRILVVLGFKEVIVIKKVRKHYHHGDVSIMIDRIEGLPDPYMEVEILADDAGALDARREQLFRYLEGVGIGRGASERRSYLELVLLARAGTSAMP
jgi:predicted adenylyl cyclase CyaB